MFSKTQQHRKAVSNNFVINQMNALGSDQRLHNQQLTQQNYITTKTFTKSTKTLKPSSQMLMNQLTFHQFKNNYDKTSSNQSYSQTKNNLPLPDSNSKRIRTEENEYQNVLQISPPIFKTISEKEEKQNPDYINVFKEDITGNKQPELGKIESVQTGSAIHTKTTTKSHSPLTQQSNQMQSMIKYLLAQKNTIKKPLSALNQKEITPNPPQKKQSPEKNEDSKIQQIKSIIEKKLIRETRNQSADFQMLLKPTQKGQQVGNNIIQNQKKKVNSYGNLHDQIYFTHRGFQDPQIQHLKCGSLKENQDFQKILQEKTKITLHKRDYPASCLNFNIPKNYQNTNSEKLATYYLEQTPLQEQKLTLQQFKEKLTNIRGKAVNQGYYENKAFPRKQSGEKLTQPPTQKKLPQQITNLYEDSGKVVSYSLKHLKRVRTEVSQYSIPISRHSLIREQSDEDTELEQRQQYVPFFQEKDNFHVVRSSNSTFQLERKIDQICQEIHSLKKKSDQLEVQNKLLNENLSRMQSDKDVHTQERVHLLCKLDQMIDMQKKQEDNLNFFKNIFQNQTMVESILTQSDQRRTKTEQSLQKQNDSLKYNIIDILPSPKQKAEGTNSPRTYCIRSEHNQVEPFYEMGE